MAACVRVACDAGQNWVVCPSNRTVTLRHDRRSEQWRWALTADTLIPGDYFQVGVGILEEAGHRSLTVSELCRRLGVSKGSFYHHFDSLQQFVDGLLSLWENSFNGWWTKADTVWEPAVRFNLAFDLLADMNHRLDMAIRSWSQTDLAVEKAVARRDATLEYAFGQTLSLVVPDTQRRHLVAQLAVSWLVGTQVRGLADREHLLLMGQEIMRSLVGVEHELTHEDGKLVLRVVPESLRAALFPEKR
jgi:AcrR family transcriptional regulator